ncbi:MAG: myo-inositol-1(or 4)-monophosphatase [Parcubacteria group bacterium Gr01-1014_106]|nr:MAG: myo-inositol-1(or 4)-monophosphatase [Parcubacteria group bacterium Gr01-1014_106]
MIRILEDVARKCGNLLAKIRMRSSDLGAENKDESLGAHFATEGDRRSQELGIRLIHAQMPEELVIAEEQANASSVPPNCTVFDPCDGTTIYYNNYSEFGVTLCTLRDGRPYAGVMYFPKDGTMISAVRTHGCFMKGKRIRLRHDRPLDKTVIGTDIGPWTIHSVLEPLSQRFCMRSSLAAIHGFRELLRGQSGAYYSLNIAKIWDVAAGALAVQEAGGIVCGPDGQPLQWNSLRMDWIAAANQQLAECVLAETRKWKGRT